MGLLGTRLQIYERGTDRLIDEHEVTPCFWTTVFNSGDKTRTFQSRLINVYDEAVVSPHNEKQNLDFVPNYGTNSVSIIWGK